MKRLIRYTAKGSITKIPLKVVAVDGVILLGGFNSELRLTLTLIIFNDDSIIDYYSRVN